MKRIFAKLAIVAILNFFFSTNDAVYGFSVSPQSRAKVVSSSPSLEISTSISKQIDKRTTSTSLKMGYNLPPAGGGGPKNELEAILPTIVTGVLIALFFASPLGGIFFAVFNSIFVLALLTPFVLFGGFQLWKTFYTIEAPCPSCGATVGVLKNGEPSVCINCGAFSRANEKGVGIELCNNPNDIMGGGTLFDSLFGPGMGNGMSGGFDNVVENVSSNKNTPSDDPVKKAKRQGTIIDVDVERD